MLLLFKKPKCGIIILVVHSSFYSLHIAHLSLKGILQNRVYNHIGTRICESFIGQ